MVQDICNKVIWLEHGVIRKMGEPEEVVEAYRKATTSAAPAST
jgi:ABC-type polysaccharide/polyol phosphate transport system ATPase subunit